MHAYWIRCTINKPNTASQNLCEPLQYLPVFFKFNASLIPPTNIHSSCWSIQQIMNGQSQLKISQKKYNHTGIFRVNHHRKRPPTQEYNDNHSKLNATRTSGMDTWRTPQTQEVLIWSLIYSLLAKYAEGPNREVEVMPIMPEVCKSKSEEMIIQDTTTGTRSTSSPMEQVSH